MPVIHRYRQKYIIVGRIRLNLNMKVDNYSLMKVKSWRLCVMKTIYYEWMQIYLRVPKSVLFCYLLIRTPTLLAQRRVLQPEVASNYYMLMLYEYFDANMHMFTLATYCDYMSIFCSYIDKLKKRVYAIDIFKLSVDYF